MNHRLSVTVHVDIDEYVLQLAVTGCLTEMTQQALHSLIRKARTFDAVDLVIVDLRDAHHVELNGIDLLQLSAGYDDPRGARNPVRILVPEPLPACPLGLDADACAPAAPAAEIELHRSVA